MAGPTQDLRDFKLAQWLVQPSLDRLSSGVAVVRIRPQLMDMLVCLAARAGRTVSRRELTAEIWPGQFTSDSGLARCVAELRQALGDSARQPRIIETIPKRGYRLIAPVAPANGRPADDCTGTPPGCERAAARADGGGSACEAPASAVSRPSPLGRVIARLSVAAMAVGARLRRPPQPSGPDRSGPGVRASAAPAL